MNTFSQQAAILTGKDDDEIDLKEDDKHLECCAKNIMVKVRCNDKFSFFPSPLPPK